MTKQEAISKIKSKPSTYLNDDQKTVAIGIINSIPEGEDVLKYFDFIMKRSDVGFKFDVAPEIATGRIAVVNEMTNLNINTSEEIDVNENKLIIGDNYEALKNLLLTHKEKIDVIYIDPPYNTEKSKEDGNASSKEGERSKFVYKDKFGRNGWLNMMRERLILARRLLTNEGVIFVSIDDTEQAYLKVLMDEIFGESNFICNFIWEKTYAPKNNNKCVSTDHDYILCYRKSDQLSVFQRLQRTEKNNSLYRYDDQDGRGVYRIDNLTVKNGKHFPIEINGQTYFPGKHNGWRLSETKIYQLIKENRIYIPQGENKRLAYKRYLNEVGGIISSSILKYGLVGHTDSNQKELNSILNQQLFDYPKGIKLIKYLIQLIPHNKNATVLDFYAGSGTTAHAVMDLNREDGAKRNFILITNNENNIGINITYNRLHRIIKGQTIEGKKDFAWIKKNDPYNNASLRVFNIKHFDVETNQIKKLDSITKFAVENLNKLNPLHKTKSNDIQIYYDLDGLNPLNEAQEKQLYSTDKIIHEPSKKINNPKLYCACGKSFNKNDELIQHIKKLNN